MIMYVDDLKYLTWTYAFLRVILGFKPTLSFTKGSGHFLSIHASSLKTALLG